MLIEHSIKAEKTEYEEIYLKKIYLCQEMQKFFLKNLAKSNMNAIKEIIKVHCLMEHNLMGNFMPIYGAMTCEDFEYLEAAQSGDHTKLRKYFKEDASTLKQEYTTVSVDIIRKNCFKMRMMRTTITTINCPPSTKMTNLRHNKLKVTRSGHFISEEFTQYFSPTLKFHFY